MAFDWIEYLDLARLICDQQNNYANVVQRRYVDVQKAVLDTTRSR